MRSMCTGACHACTASHCDLRDPGWGDPGSRHCDFFAWHLSAHPVMFFVGLSFCCFNGWPARYEAHKLPCYCVFSPVVHDAVIPPFCGFLWVFLVSVCWFFVFRFLLLWFVFFVLFLLVFVSLCGMTSHGLAPRIQEACHSIGFTCSN